MATGVPTDAQVAPYADNAFEYDADHRVIREVVQGGGASSAGGLGVYAYAYTASNNPAGYNSWAMKTVVTNPDGSTDTVYTNASGEVMLTDHRDPGSGLHWDEFYVYNGQGKVVLDAAPSAVAGYDDAYADLLHYQSQSGLYQYLYYAKGVVTHTDYYQATTSRR